ncbi:MAG: hypothetical protein VXY53_02330 [Candidatus Thermoplasmatota archaeon]|nr:hypothetical protein [Candidatus Thermoplasmatota archaeon]
MYELFLWFIAFVCLGLPAWLVYNSWSKSRVLNERLANCDDTLLSDSSVKVTQIVSAPVGTTVTENATLVVMPVNQAKKNEYP